MASPWLDELYDSLNEGHATSSSIAWSSNNLIATVVDDSTLGASVAIALHVLSPGPASRQIPLTRLDLPEPFPAYVSQLKFSPDGAFLAVVAVLNTHNPRLRLIIYRRESLGLSDRWSLFHERYIYRNDAVDVQPIVARRSPNHVLALQWLGPRRKWVLDDQDMLYRTSPRGPISYGFVLVAALDTEEIVIMRFSGPESTPTLSCVPLSLTSSHPISLQAPQYFPSENGPLGQPLPCHSTAPFRSSTVTHATFGFSKNSSLLVAYYSKYLSHEALSHVEPSQSIPAPIPDPTNPSLVPSLDSTTLTSDSNGIDMSNLDSQFLLSDLDIDMDPLDDFASEIPSNPQPENDTNTNKSPVTSVADKFFGARAEFESPDAQITNTVQLSEIYFQWDCVDSDSTNAPTLDESTALITVKSLPGILFSPTNTAISSEESDTPIDKTLSQLLFVQNEEKEQDLVLLSVSSIKSNSANTATVSSLVNTWSLTFQCSKISDAFNSLDNPIPSRGIDDQKQPSYEWSVSKLKEMPLNQISKKDSETSCLIVSCLFDPLESPPGKFLMLSAISQPPASDQPSSNQSSHIEIMEFSVLSLNQIDTESTKRISFSSHPPSFVHACISPNNGLLALSTYHISDNPLSVFSTSNKLSLSKSNNISRSRRVRIMLLPPRNTNIKQNGVSNDEGQHPPQISDQRIAPTLAMSIISNSEPTDIVYRLAESLKTDKEVVDIVRDTWSITQKNYKGPPGPIERSPLFLELVSLQYFIYRQYDFAKSRAKILRDLLQLSSSARSFVKCRSFSRATPSIPRPMDIESVWSMLGAMQWIVSYFNQVFLTISKLDETRFGEEQDSSNYDASLVLLFHPVTFSLFIQMTAPIRDFGRFLVYLRPQPGSTTSPLKTQKEFLQLELAIQIYTSIVDYRPDGTQRSPEDKTQLPEIQSLTFLERMSRLLGEVGKLVGAGWQGTQLEPQITAQRETFITGRLPEALFPTAIKVIKIVREYWSHHGTLSRKRKRGKENTTANDVDSLTLSFEKCAQRAFKDDDDTDDECDEGEQNNQTNSPIIGKLSNIPSKRQALFQKRKTTFFDVVNYQSGQILYSPQESVSFGPYSSHGTHANTGKSSFAISQVSSDKLRKCVRCGKVSSLPPVDLFQVLSKPIVGGPLSVGGAFITNHGKTSEPIRDIQGFDAFRSLYRWRCPCAGMWVGFR